MIAPSHLTKQWQDELEANCSSLQVIVITTKVQHEKVSQSVLSSCVRCLSREGPLVDIVVLCQMSACHKRVQGLSVDVVVLRDRSVVVTDVCMTVCVCTMLGVIPGRPQC